MTAHLRSYKTSTFPENVKAGVNASLKIRLNPKMKVLSAIVQKCAGLVIVFNLPCTFPKSINSEFMPNTLCGICRSRMQLDNLIAPKPTCKPILYNALQANMTLLTTGTLSSLSMYARQPIVFDNKAGSFLLNNKNKTEIKLIDIKTM